MLLRTDIARAVDGFCQLPIKVIKACGIVQKRVLVEMIFNMGLKGVMRFQKMLAAIEKGHFHVAAEEMLDSKWAEQCGSRVSLLAEQMREG